MPEALKSPDPNDGNDYLPFFLSLKASGYSGLISPPTDATRKTIAYCVELCAKAGMG